MIEQGERMITSAWLDCREVKSGSKFWMSDCGCRAGVVRSSPAGEYAACCGAPPPAPPGRRKRVPHPIPPGWDVFWVLITTIWKPPRLLPHLISQDQDTSGYDSDMTYRPFG